MTNHRPRLATPIRYSVIGIAACAYAASARAAPVTWNINASGLWTTAANWSSTPSLPGALDDVTINQPGPLTVTLSSGTQSINSLVVDNTLAFSAGTLAVAHALQVNGTFNISGGTLQNATLSTAGSGAITFTGGTFDGVTLASSLSLGASASMTLQNGLTLSNSTVDINSGSVLFFNGNQTIGGTGIIEFDGAGFISQSSPTTITTGPNVTIQTGTTSGLILTAGLINQGTLSAQGSGKTLTINSGTSLTNTGILQAGNGGTINIAGNLTTTALGAFNSTGGTVEISGTLDNSASVLALNGVGNSLLLAGTIKNGTISAANGAVLTVAGGTLDGVTLASNLPVGAGAAVTLKDGLTLSNSTISIVNGSVLAFSGNQTVGGTGIIEFDGAGFISQSGTPTATIGANVTIQTGTASGLITTAGLINQGTLSAQGAGKTLTISSGTSLTNAGTIQASNGGTIIIAGTITPSGIGTFNSTGGTIQISGTFDNTGNTLVLNGVGNSLLLTGTLKNGTFSTTNGAVLTISGGTFDGVTLASTLSLGASVGLNLKDGLTLSNSTVSLNSASNLVLNGNQTLGGTGIVEFDGNGFIAPIGSSTATIGPNVTIQTGAGTGSISTTGLINQGLISAQTSGKPITISSPTFSNTGTLQTLNGDTLIISGNLTSAGLGTFNSTGGTIQISGTIDAAASTLALSGAGNSLLLTGTIKNGPVSLAGGAQLTISSGTPSIAALNVLAGGNLHQSGGTVTITALTQSGGNVSLGGSQTLYAIPSISITGGMTTLTNDIAKVLTTNALTFGGTTNAWTGSLDLVNNKLILEDSATHAASLVTLRNQAAFAATHANSGGLFGSGQLAGKQAIVLDNTAEGLSTFGGQPVDAGSILSLVTFLGDANLDGVVNITDLNTVAANWQHSTAAWTKGDFNGDGIVNISDLNTLAAHWQAGAGGGSSESLAPQSVTPAPEPTTLAILPLATFVFQMRRRISK